jgi:hypothetical protein
MVDVLMLGLSRRIRRPVVLDNMLSRMRFKNNVPVVSPKVATMSFKIGEYE